MKNGQSFFGLFNRRERWGLSWVGWLAALLLAGLTCIVLIVSVFPFLAITERVDAKILVVEGWIPEFGIHAAAAEFSKGHYEVALATGGPVTGIGGYINDYQTSASVGAGRLRAAGIPDDSLQMVPSHILGRDRTYSSAVALREWFRGHNMTVHGFNIVTEDVHARRSRLLFEEAFGDSVRIGIIAVPNPDYDAKHWWRYSEGVKDVFSEGIAYIYVTLFFHPPAASRDERAFGKNAANSKP